MDDRHTTTDTDPERSPSDRTSGGSGAPETLGQGGPLGNPSGPRDANDPGSTRYGAGRSSGSNESKHDEVKEQGDWISRQGGDQSSGPGTEPSHDAKENQR